MKTSNGLYKLFIAAVLMLIMLFSTAVFAIDNPELASFDVILLSYEPSPAEPGKYIDLTIQATNIGRKASTNAKFALSPEYPFSLDPDQTALKEFGAVGSQKQVILTYTVRVDQKAVFGETPLQINYTTDGSNWLSRDLSINIKTSEAILSIAKISKPETLVPGETAQINITVQNLAASLMKDVTIRLDLATETATTATAIVTRDLPFIPVDSGMEKKVKYINTGDEEVFSFNLMTYGDAESKIYKIPMVITFKDESGTEYAKNEVLGIVVGAKPKLSIEVGESTLKTQNGFGKVSLKIVNKGVTNVRFLSASLAQSKDYEQTTALNGIYIGNIDSNDYETVDFQLKPLKKDISLKVNLEYSDANNKPYTESFDVLVPVNESASGQKSSSPWLFVLVLVIIGGIIFFFWKKKRRSHKKE
jgi:LPXTG-motif cell wall-anchored protein